MRSLTEIIYEKLKINKETSSKLDKFGDFYDKTIKVDIPNFDCEEGSLKDGIWRSINFPKKKYYIYRDAYRGFYLHFADFEDFLCQLVWFQDDYENFDLNKDILFASDDLDEIFEWYTEKLGYDKINEYKISKIEWDEIGLNYYISQNRNKIRDPKICTCDSVEFFVKLATGEWNEKEFHPGIKITDEDYKNFPAWCEKNILY